jgi:hypothetical protein
MEELNKVRVDALELAPPLHRAVLSGYYQVYDNLDDVMMILSAKYSKSKIFIYIKDIKKYMLFNDENEYASFINLALPRPAPGEIMINRGDFEKYQIITTDIPQKLILAYNSKDVAVINEICQQAKIHFGAESVMCCNNEWNLEQLVVDIILNCFDDNKTHCEDFYRHLEKYKKGYGKGLSKPPVYSNIEYSIDYINAIVRHKSTIMEESFKKSLPAPKDVVVNIGAITINNGSNNTTNNNVTNNITNNVNTRPSKITEQAIKFIRENPPDEREKKADYYDRYKKYCSVNKLMPLTKGFGALMSAQGYVEKHTGPLFYWAKV